MPVVTGVMPSLRNSVPFSGKVVTVTETTVPSESVPASDTGIRVSSSPETESGVATGGALTVMLTVAVSVPPLPSETVYVKEAGPV